MGQALWAQKKTARAIYDLAEEALGYKVIDLKSSQLSQTVYAQPAIVTYSLALWAVWQEEGGQSTNITAMAGFSLGEYSCLAVAGVLDMADLFRLVQLRAAFMQQAAESTAGQMTAVLGLPAEKVQQILSTGPWQGQVFPVNYNAPGQLVISGLARAMPGLSQALRAAGARQVIPLKVSGAFHTPYMALAARQLQAAAADFTFRPAQYRLYSNLDGQPLPADTNWPAYLASHLCHPVRWHEAVTNMHKDGATTFLEFGPGKVLTGLARRICPAARARNMDQ